MNYLTQVMAIVVVCSTTANAAANDVKVSWPGETFLNVTYKQIGQRQIKLDIYLPSSGNAEAAPVLYYVHGGGWAAGSKDKGGLPLMLPVFEQVAEKGFACVSINYRLQSTKASCRFVLVCVGVFVFVCTSNRIQ